MSKRTGVVVGALALIAAGIFVFEKNFRSVDDKALESMFVGTWRAQDVDNGALNHRSGGVAEEKVIVSTDGTLKYLVIPKPGQGEPAADNYSWKIAKGKLRLRFISATGTQDELPSLPISVDQSRLSLHRRGFSKKIFDRVNS